jgi:hypothetical protein
MAALFIAMAVSHTYYGVKPRSSLSTYSGVLQTKALIFGQLMAESQPVTP